jgi:hypothetical protein
VKALVLIRRTIGNPGKADGCEAVAELAALITASKIPPTPAVGR